MTDVPRKKRRAAKAAAPAPAEKKPEPGRLVLTSYAPLQIVQAANYLRYGAAGVRQFGPGAPENPLPHPQRILVNLRLKRGTGTVLLALEEIALHNTTPEKPFDLEGTTIWAGERKAAHLELIWVWDFYRLYSGVRVAAVLPTEENAAETWRTVSVALRSLQAGDQMILEARSPSGDILQVYPIDAGAFAVEPLNKH